MKSSITNRPPLQASDNHSWIHFVPLHYQIKMTTAGSKLNIMISPTMSLSLNNFLFKMTKTLLPLPIDKLLRDLPTICQSITTNKQRLWLSREESFQSKSPILKVIDKKAHLIWITVRCKIFSNPLHHQIKNLSELKTSYFLAQ